jgi:hypothetical protein
MIFSSLIIIVINFHIFIMVELWIMSESVLR